MPSEFIRRIGNKLSSTLSGGHVRTDPIASFAMAPHEIGSYFDHDLSEIEKMFLRHKGRPIHKWVHFLPLYDRLFSGYRNRNICFLEIGINKGGSLELWREYFGNVSTRAGIDIDAECASRVDPPNMAFIGSQDDPEFLVRTVASIGRPDIVLDDGSHVAEHQKASFETLFPLLKEGGLYVIEDTHTSYWTETYNGGYGRAGTAVELSKSFIDDMHAWYHSRDYNESIRDQVKSITLFDSVIALEKQAPRLPPRHMLVAGQQSAIWDHAIQALDVGSRDA